jgi:sulfide:quinone oxidoreductase
LDLGKQILILGGGFGGLAAAHLLRKGLNSEHVITVVDRQPLFLMGLTKLWIIDNRREVGQNPGNRTQLASRGINFVEGDATAINTAAHEVRVGRERFGYDYLIIALGADYTLSSPNGIARYATNMYNESGCAEIRDLLRSLKSGTLSILVCGPRFKCPPAPYEASFIIDQVLRKNAVRDKVKLQIITPEPQPLGILGPDAGKIVTSLLASRGIAYHPSQHVKEIQRKSVVTEEGKEFEHDFVFAIPIHVASPMLKESGLLDGTGWVGVDSQTLATKVPGIYAVGDCAGIKTPTGSMLPMVGALAEEQGKVVAQNIVNELQGVEKSATFQGEADCIMEVGGENAAPIHANFYAQPSPKWEYQPPSEEGYRKKVRYLDERMSAWFA